MIISNLKLFIAQLGWRLGVMFLILLLAGIVEGFGVSMILPHLESDIGESDNKLARLISGLFNMINLAPTSINFLALLVIFFLRKPP